MRTDFEFMRKNSTIYDTGPVLIFSITCFRKGFCHWKNFLQSDFYSNLFVMVRTIDLVLIMAPVLCNFDNLYYQNIEVIFKFIYRYFIFIKNAIELCTVLCLFKIHVLNTFPLPFNLYRFWILFTYLGIVHYQEKCDTCVCLCHP